MGQTPPPGHGMPWYGPPPPPEPPRARRWLPWVIVGALLLVLIGAAGTAFVVTRLNGGAFSPPSIFSPQLPAQMGQPLVINGVTVALVSVTVTQETSLFGGPYQIAYLGLHCSNQTNYVQSVPMNGWRLYIDGGTTLYYPLNQMLGVGDQSGCSLAPNQTGDLQFTIDMAASDHSPYTLQSDFTTSGGTPLAWTFTA